MSASKGKHGPLIGAIDQGTSSSRFLVFAAETAELLTYHQEEVKQFLPQEGWVEQDPLELLSSVEKCIEQTVKNLIALDIDPGDIVAVGITNQRETTIVWDKETGEVLHNAIVWLDSRTKETVDTFLAKVPNRNMDVLKDKTGLPLSTYFSAFKMRWLLDKIGPVQEAVTKKTACFGTVDSWLIWNLSGGIAGGLHMTDVTNASRTMLMNIHTLQWDPELCKFFQIPSTLLPVIKSSSEIYCHVSKGSLKGVPISGCLGDQQAALVGQLCLSPGQAKNTYGTGCFLLYNTGTEAVVSQHGLLTTVAYQWEGESPCYALEGSVAVAGGVVRWLRDNLQLLDNVEQIQSLAASVTDTGGVYFVPAFSGLYAPYWRMDARGVLCGLTQFTTRAHIARAALEAVCFQTKDLIEAMKHDTEVALTSLKVDGGMPSNDLLMQLQADILGIPILRPCMMETTSLGVAIAAGRALGVWKIPQESTTEDMAVDKFSPQISERNRDTRYGRWKDAVARTLGWEVTAETTSTSTDAHERRIKALPGIGFTFVSFCLCVLADYLQSAARHS